MLHQAITAKLRDARIFDAHVAAVLKLLLCTVRAKNYESSSFEDAACLARVLPRSLAYLDSGFGAGCAFERSAVFGTADASCCGRERGKEVGEWIGRAGSWEAASRWAWVAAKASRVAF